MSVITYPISSPYAKTPQTSWYLGRIVFRDIPPDAGDQPYVLAAHHAFRPDRLSYELYGTGAYYWVFAVRNPFLRADPLWLFTTGTEIIVPAADYLRRVLGS